MAKSKVVQKKSTEVKESNSSTRRERNILHQEVIRDPRCKEIDQKIESLINVGNKTKMIIESIINEFSISICEANNHIKRTRKKLKIYNYGDLPVSVKENNAKQLAEMLKNNTYENADTPKKTTRRRRTNKKSTEE